MSAKIVELIETATTRGRGTKEEPIRLVTQYYSKAGELIFEKDPREVDFFATEVINPGDFLSVDLGTGRVERKKA